MVTLAVLAEGTVQGTGLMVIGGDMIVQEGGEVSGGDSIKIWVVLMDPVILMGIEEVLIEEEEEEEVGMVQEDLGGIPEVEGVIGESKIE